MSPIEVLIVAYLAVATICWGYWYTALTEDEAATTGIEPISAAWIAALVWPATMLFKLGKFLWEALNDPYA